MSLLPKSPRRSLPLLAILVAPLFVGSLAGHAGVSHLDSPWFVYLGVGSVLATILFWPRSNNDGAVPGCLVSAVVIGLGAMESFGILLGPCCDHQGAGLLAMGSFLVAIPCVILLAVRVRREPAAADDAPVNIV